MAKWLQSTIREVRVRGESVYFESGERGRESQYYCVGYLSSGFDMCL